MHIYDEKKIVTHHVSDPRFFAILHGKKHTPTPGWLGWLVGWLGWLAGWLDGWLAGWLVGWLAGWLVGWWALTD